MWPWIIANSGWLLWGGLLLLMLWMHAGGHSGHGIHHDAPEEATHPMHEPTVVDSTLVPPSVPAEAPAPIHTPVTAH